MSVKAKYRGSTVSVSAIQSEMRLTGDVGRAARRDAKLLKNIATLTAPSRTGGLRRAHEDPRYSPMGLRLYVSIQNNSTYARFVHEGTTGPIVARNPSGFLWIRPMPHSRFRSRMPLASVAGQRANPWMSRAMLTVMRKYTF